MFSCNTSAPAKVFPHFWEKIVGSGHAKFALRADWQKDLARCSGELGFKYVRFHGILSDDIDTLNKENDKLIYSFFNADQIIDFLLSIGMKPFVELSFMPKAIASGDECVFKYKANITQPRHFNEWEMLIEKLVRHWIKRYGVEEIHQWYFEVWNEPNLSAFWKGSQYDYFNFYRHTATILKNIDAELKVGGPATAKNEWIKEFLQYCNDLHVAVDFVSTHHYPTDAFGNKSNDTRKQLAKSERSVLRKQAMKANQEACNKPLYYTEWSSSSNPFDELHDQCFAAAFLVKTIIEAQGFVEGYSWWTFSDIFEENYFSSAPFHGGFGLMNIQGIAKPTYRAFQLLHSLGQKQYEVSGVHETVDAWIFEKENKLQILITNFALPDHFIKEENAGFEITCNKKFKKAYVEKIDKDHANATEVWYQMSKPDTLSKEEVKMLHDASSLKKEELKVENKDAKFSFSIPVWPQSISCVTIETE